jgi:uncharacterized membrane protein
MLSTVLAKALLKLATADTQSETGVGQRIEHAQSTCAWLHVVLCVALALLALLRVPR